MTTPTPPEGGVNPLDELRSALALTRVEPPRPRGPPQPSAAPGRALGGLTHQRRERSAPAAQLKGTGVLADRGDQRAVTVTTGTRRPPPGSAARPRQARSAAEWRVPALATRDSLPRLKESRSTRGRERRASPSTGAAGQGPPEGYPPMGGALDYLVQRQVRARQGGARARPASAPRRKAAERSRTPPKVGWDAGLPDKPKLGDADPLPPEEAAGAEEETEERDEEKEAVGALPMIQSIFAGMPPTIFFGYPAEYGVKAHGGRLFMNTKAPKMYHKHTNLVHPYNSVLNTLKKANFKATQQDKWALLWSAQPKPEELRAFHAYQKTNHFPASWHLGRKDLLWRHMNRMCRKYGAGYELTPQTYVLPDDQNAFAVDREQHPKSIWIFKPSNASCGRGIKLLQGPQAKLPKKPGVAQKYVDSPFLINGYKFDMRVYCVVTGFDPLRVYFFDELLVRIATTKYSTNSKTLKERTMHLTNYSVNKHSDAYVKNQDGPSSPVKERSASCPPKAAKGLDPAKPDPATALDKAQDAEDGEDEDEGAGGGAGGEQDAQASKWSLADLRAYLEEHGHDTDAMLAKVKDMAVKTMLAAEPAIVSHLHQGACVGGRVQEPCFEVFGLDVLLDSDLRPWLLEVNVSPSLSSSSPFDRRIKTMLMADVLTLIGMEPFDAREVEQQQHLERERRLLGKGEPPRSRNVQKLLETQVTEFGESEWRLIMSTYDEFMRKGRLEILFPRPENVHEYSKYFGTARYNNVVLQKWLEKDGKRVFHHIEQEGA